MKILVEGLLKGEKISIAGLDTILVPDDCIIEVPEEVGNNLVKNIGWKEVSVESSEDKVDLSKLKKSELLELAAASGFPEEEYSSLTTVKLVEYLNSKLK